MPLTGHTSKEGLNNLTCAARLGDEVATIDLSFSWSRVIDSLKIIESEGLARSRVATIWNSSLRSAGTSLRLCTAMSASPITNASSSRLTKTPFPPNS